MLQAKNLDDQIKEFWPKNGPPAQEVKKYIKKYLKEKIGSTMHGVVTGVTDFGLFINLEPYFISGLLHVSDLPDDHYHFLHDRSILKGKKRGGIYKLGQKIKVKIAAIFPLERKINLVISNGK